MVTVEAQSQQITSHVVMVSPDQFGFNPQTAESNVFQHDLSGQGHSPEEVQQRALLEFNTMVQTLRDNGVTVSVLPSLQGAIVPDAVFPNNWFSHHQDGTLIVYPMLTENRRAERQIEPLVSLLESLGAKPVKIIDLTAEELKETFLEGTGSLVLDRVHKVAFAMQSPRTAKEGLEVWCETTGYEPFLFHAYDKHSRPLYHTNVFMNMGEGFVIACPESIASNEERQRFVSKLKSLDKELIAISLDQAYAFCGNILQLKSADGSAKIVLSETALDALSTHQQTQLQEHGQLVAMAIPTIEAVGGGGVRCMMAEIFPPDF